MHGIPVWDTHGGASAPTPSHATTLHSGRPSPSHRGPGQHSPAFVCGAPMQSRTAHHTQGQTCHRWLVTAFAPPILNIAGPRWAACHYQVLRLIRCHHCCSETSGGSSAARDRPDPGSLDRHTLSLEYISWTAPTHRTCAIVCPARSEGDTNPPTMPLWRREERSCANHYRDHAPLGTLKPLRMSAFHHSITLLVHCRSHVDIQPSEGYTSPSNCSPKQQYARIRTGLLRS